MEIFLDFGLFEVAAVLGLAGAARVIYSRRLTAAVFLAMSVLAPTILVFLSRTVATRSLAVVCVATSLVNTAAMVVTIQRRPSALRDLFKGRA